MRHGLQYLFDLRDLYCGVVAGAGGLSILETADHLGIFTHN